MSKQSSKNLLNKLHQTKVVHSSQSGRSIVPPRHLYEDADEGSERGTTGGGRGDLPPRGRQSTTPTSWGGGRGRSRGRGSLVRQVPSRPSLSDVPSASGSVGSEEE
jgi:hypothetical protein